MKVGRSLAQPKCEAEEVRGKSKDSQRGHGEKSPVGGRAHRKAVKLKDLE